MTTCIEIVVNFRRWSEMLLVLWKHGRPDLTFQIPTWILATFEVPISVLFEKTCGKRRKLR